MPRDLDKKKRWLRASGKNGDYQRQYRYGISPEQFAAMLASQDGGCASCGSTDPGARGSFCVDHDHACCPGIRSCGRCIRGLLCLPCNTAAGQMKDSPEALRALAAYLDR